MSSRKKSYDNQKALIRAFFCHEHDEVISGFETWQSFDFYNTYIFDSVLSDNSDSRIFKYIKSQYLKHKTLLRKCIKQ